MGEEWGVGVKRPFWDERMTGTRNSGLCSMTDVHGATVGWVWDGCVEGQWLVGHLTELRLRPWDDEG